MLYLLNGGEPSGAEKQPSGKGNSRIREALEAPAGETADTKAASETGSKSDLWDMTPEEIANLPPEERDKLLSDNMLLRGLKGLGDFLTYPARQANRE